MDLAIAKPLTLKCGLTLPNRLVKAAMAERLGDRKSLPTDKSLLGAYEAWSNGGWGMLITGNVDVDPTYIGTSGDIVVDLSLPREKILAAWKPWAATTTTTSPTGGPPIIVQLNHPGRQVQLKRGIAPSSIPMDFGPGLLPRLLNSLIFGTPKEMTQEDITSTISHFAQAAKLCSEAGFAGIELHAAHGYLLAQFLSPASNQRKDKYGGSPLARAQFAVEIISAIREVVPPSFCIGIKLNSADHQVSSEMKDSIRQIRAIADAGVDFLEISGGTYERPLFAAHERELRPERASTRLREALFLEFAAGIRGKFPGLPLMVTGGFRSRRGMEDAVAGGECDLVGMGRVAALSPGIARERFLNADVPDEEAVGHVERRNGSVLGRIVGVKAVGVGAESVWYAEKIREMGKRELDASVSRKTSNV